MPTSGPTSLPYQRALLLQLVCVGACVLLRTMPYVSSSGRVFHVDGPEGGSTSADAGGRNQQRLIAYSVIAISILLSLVMLVKLGSAASAAVASVSGAVRVSSSMDAVPARSMANLTSS